MPKPKKFKAGDSVMDSGGNILFVWMLQSFKGRDIPDGDYAMVGNTQVGVKILPLQMLTKVE